MHALMSKPSSVLAVFLVLATAYPLQAQSLSGRILYAGCSGDVSRGCDPSVWSISEKGEAPNLLIRGSVARRGEGNLAVSPDGKRISFNTYRYSGWKLAMADVVDGEVRNVEKFTTSGDYEYNLKWSPDGKKVVFQVYNWSKNDADIFIANPDRSQVVNLTNQRGGDRTPTFSADGQRILFNSGRTGNYEILSMNLEGQDVQNLTNNAAHDIAPSVSHEGHIAFLSNREGPLDLFVLERAGTTPVNVTKGRYGKRFVFDDWQNSLSWAYKTSWSPDGKEVVFNLKIEGDYELFKANTETGAITQLTDNEGDDFDPYWVK